MDITTQVFSILMILLALVVTAILSRRRREPFTLRSIPAYEMIPTLAGRAIEANQPMHISLGSAGIGGQTTLLAIVSAELAYHAARHAAVGDASPLLTLNNASALPLAQDTLRRAYEARGLIRRYQGRSVRWYPTGPRSLAFAAAITAVMGDDNVSSNVMAGSYGPELALIMDASARRNLPVIAVSDQLEGQAIAYALSDEPLIGEEIFVSSAYLGERANQTADAVTIDVLRWLLIAAMLAGLVFTLMNNGG